MRKSVGKGNRMWKFTAAVSIVAFIITLGGYTVMAKGKQPDVFKLGFMTSFSGVFAAVAETQKKGVLLKVDQINNSGGLNMPWGKVKIKVLMKDDEAKLDVGVRRYRELVGNGIDGMIGTTYNPMAAAVNEESKLTNIPFLPSAVPALDSFRKGNPAKGTFSVAFTPWSIGYLVGGSVVKELNQKRLFFVPRADSWGATILEGLQAALKEFGGELVGVESTPKGTMDYTPIINKALVAKPGAFITSMFGSDAIGNLKQAYELGLYDKSKIFNTWTTNVVATGIPGEALDGMYALMYYYYDMEGFEDEDLVKRAREFTNAHMKMWNEPPDAYGAIAYVAADILFQAVEKAGSFDNDKISKVLKNSKFQTIKGEVYFREDQQMVSKYLAFLVKGKSSAAKKGKWDVFEVVGYFGGDQALPSLKSLGY
ncbi:MAG: ABC transporter substrate-binding protein [bacterium]